MLNDTIVEEIHQIRAQLLAQHGGDFAALVKKQLLHPEQYASFAQPASTSQPASSSPLAQ